jgi:hypothetical protein
MSTLNLNSQFSQSAAGIKQINYLSRDFQTIRTDLINYLKAFFPEQWQDFNVASPGMALLELNAYVGDLFSFTIDKKYNELFLDGVQKRSSVYRMAKTFGFKVPGVRPSLTIVDITIEVPTTANVPDYSYVPVIRPGLQIQGAGQTFETVYEIDFSSDYSEDGKKNRTIQPVFNGNQTLIKYKILKRELVKAGVSKIIKFEIPSGTEKPFMQFTLPETNVLEIVDVIAEPGIGLNKTPTYEDFHDSTKRFWEVDYLATDKIFVEDDTQDSVNGVKIGKYLQVSKRFIKEFMSDGTCRLTFGGGQENYDSYEEYLQSLTTTTSCCGSVANLNISSLLLNPSLGEMLQGNTTLYIKYRVGGGALSNVGSNVLQSVSNINAVILGADANLNQAVFSSIRANNPIPAIGGRGLPTVSEIKNFIASNFAAQDRCVTLEDYISRSYQIPGKFGAPFRIHGVVNDNKIILYILTKDANEKLNAISTSEIKRNLISYLTPYRMINDFVEINDGKFVNLDIEVDLFVDKTYNSSEVKLNAILKIKDFFQIDNWQMNQHIYISQLTDILREVPGVINVVDIRMFNLEGGVYSSVLSSQAIGNRTQDTNTGVYKTQIEYMDNTLYSTPTSMFEIRYPDQNIKVRTA